MGARLSSRLGTVQTEVSLRLPGATVILRGTYTGGSTNAEKLFQIKADFSKGLVILLVPFIGYEIQGLLLNAPDNALTVKIRPSVVFD